VRAASGEKIASGGQRWRRDGAGAVVSPLGFRNRQAICGIDRRFSESRGGKGARNYGLRGAIAGANFVA
jgi:hypothetical protein